MMDVTHPTMVAFPCRRCWLAALLSTPATPENACTVVKHLWSFPEQLELDIS